MTQGSELKVSNGFSKCKPLDAARGQGSFALSLFAVRRHDTHPHTHISLHGKAIKAVQRTSA